VAIRREHGLTVGQVRVARLKPELEISRMGLGKTIFTTKPGKTNPQPPDIVKRQFTASRPNVL